MSVICPSLPPSLSNLQTSPLHLLQLPVQANVFVWKVTRGFSEDWTARRGWPESPASVRSSQGWRSCFTLPLSCHMTPMTPSRWDWYYRPCRYVLQYLLCVFETGFSQYQHQAVYLPLALLIPLIVHVGKACYVGSNYTMYNEGKLPKKTTPALQLTCTYMYIVLVPACLVRLGYCMGSHQSQPLTDICCVATRLPYTDTCRFCLHC